MAHSAEVQNKLLYLLRNNVLHCYWNYKITYKGPKLQATFAKYLRWEYQTLQASLSPQPLSLLPASRLPTFPLSTLDKHNNLFFSFLGLSRPSLFLNHPSTLFQVLQIAWQAKILQGNFLSYYEDAVLETSFRRASPHVFLSQALGFIAFVSPSVFFCLFLIVPFYHHEYLHYHHHCHHHHNESLHRRKSQFTGLCENTKSLYNHSVTESENINPFCVRLYSFLLNVPIKYLTEASLQIIGNIYHSYRLFQKCIFISAYVHEAISECSRFNS